MSEPQPGDKVVVHYDDGSFVEGELVDPKPCWQYLLVKGHVYIINEHAISITKVEK